MKAISTQSLVPGDWFLMRTDDGVSVGLKSQNGGKVGPSFLMTGIVTQRSSATILRIARPLIVPSCSSFVGDSDSNAVPPVGCLLIEDESLSLLAMAPDKRQIAVDLASGQWSNFDAYCMYGFFTRWSIHYDHAGADEPELLFQADVSTTR